MEIIGFALLDGNIYVDYGFIVVFLFLVNFYLGVLSSHLTLIAL
jgi:hypothetical protein